MRSAITSDAGLTATTPSVALNVGVLATYPAITAA